MKKKYQKPEIITVASFTRDSFMSHTFDSASPNGVKDTVMESNEYDDSRSHLWYDD